MIAFPTYYLRWRPIGFRQVAFLRGIEFQRGERFKASGQEIARWSGMSLSTFRRRVTDPLLRGFVKPSGAIRPGISWIFGADGRPHQETAEWEVVMSMALTPHDQKSLRRWFQIRLDRGLPPVKALRQALELPVSDLLPLPETCPCPRWPGNLARCRMSSRRSWAIGCGTPSGRSPIRRMLLRCRSPGLRNHRVSLLRSQVDPYSGHRSGVDGHPAPQPQAGESGLGYEIEIGGGYEELAGLLGFSTWTIARWLRKGIRPALAIRRNVEESEAIRRPDNRVSRRFRVSDLEPLVEDGRVHQDVSQEAKGTLPKTPRAAVTRSQQPPRVRPRAIDTRSPADPCTNDTEALRAPRAGSTRTQQPPRAIDTHSFAAPRANDTEPPAPPRAPGTGSTGGGGVIRQSSQNKKKTSSVTSRDVAHADGVQEQTWDHETLLFRARVNPRARAAIADASGAAFVSWMLYAASARGKSISDPVGHAVNRLRTDPETGAGGVFDRLANLRPGGLIRLLADPGTARYISGDWAQAMDGADQSRLQALREMLSDVEEVEEDLLGEREKE